MNKNLEWVFKIVTKKEMNINIPTRDINKYPVFQHYNFELTEVFVLYKFHPVASTCLVNYKQYLIKYYKQKYRAYSVEFLEPLTKLEQKNTKTA